MDIEVLKFGGSSLVSASSLRKVAETLVRRRSQKRIVVCSAMGRATNDLITIGLKASRGEESFRKNIQALEQRHLLVSGELGFDEKSQQLPAEIKGLLEELKDLSEGLFLIGELSAKSMDHLVSFGERMAVPLVSAWLKQVGLHVRRVDARDWIVTDENYGAAEVMKNEASHLIRQSIEEDMEFEVLITEGFIGRSKNGNATTLGRGGSDYTASLIASAVEARCMEKSTDVPGMLTADPRIVPDAKVIDEMSYEEAMELCHFGAKVIYHPTIQPLRKSGIPLIVRSTFESESLGTRIVQSPTTKALVRGLSSVNEISLITLEGGQTIGKPGFSSRIFSLLAEHQINVVLITQSSSENSLTLGIADSDLEAGKAALSSGLESDILLKRLAPLRIDSGLSIVAIVGGGMVSTYGVSGRAFQALARARVNVRAIAQGSTELNISIVVSTEDVPNALKALHRRFFQVELATEVNVFCAGVGQVGSSFLGLLLNRKTSPALNVNFNVVGVANSKRFAFLAEGELEWRQALNRTDGCQSIREAFDAFCFLPLPNKVWVDNTASAEVAALTVEALNQGISVICSNKIAASQSMQEWSDIQAAMLANKVFFANETNVGAALPVLGTLRTMIQSGDKIQCIEGVLSGSLNYIFSSLDRGVSFESAVNEAVDLGYAEPDARLDLSGRDVARKILILARQCGAAIESSSVSVQGFLKPGAMEASFEGFMQDLSSWGEPVTELHHRAKIDGKRLRYIARWDGAGICECALESLPVDHPFFGLEGTDNAIAISSLRYNKSPLVIQGSGAGAEITASGVLSDLYAIGNFVSVTPETRFI
jgi:aspartokinase/homoserine dehydrogenase 1